jgi:hypothetical protein
MYQAPMQNNNRPQHQNPKHPANVANKVALARVKMKFAPKMMPAARGVIADAHYQNRTHPNETFFTPKAQRAADKMFARNASPIQRVGNRAENFLQLREFGKEITQDFDPRTKAGLVNVASMFVGGPKGDASPMMGKLGMPGQFRDYGGAEINPLSRGLTREGMGPGRGGAGMRGLMRRAQGVGDYKPANPLDVIEGKHAERSNLRETTDMLKHYSNRQGFRQKARSQFTPHTQAEMEGRYSEATGGVAIPYSMRDAVKSENRQDRVFSSDEGLDNFVTYLAHYMDKGHSFHEGSMKAVWDYLFGGEMHQFPGTGPFPKKP